MSSSVVVPPVPNAKPFRIALVQVGQISANKAVNLVHARELILKAAAGGGSAKPDFIVLPVRTLCCLLAMATCDVDTTVLDPTSIVARRGGRVGVLQLTVWVQVLPGVRRDDWLSERDRIRCGSESERER